MSEKINKIIEILVKQYLSSAEGIPTSVVTILFYTKKHPHIPGTSSLWIKIKKSKRWFREAKSNTGFSFQKRIRIFREYEIRNLLSMIKMDDLEIEPYKDEVLIKNNETRKFILRCVSIFEKYFKYQDVKHRREAKIQREEQMKGL